MAFRRALKAAAWLAVLVVSFVLYRSEHALMHFLWHLVYGGSFGLLIGAAYSLARQVPARHPSVWFGIGYLYMIVPDLIWIGPRLAGSSVHPHQPWMDVFLGHVFFDTWQWTNHLLVPTLALAALAFGYAARRSSPDASNPA